MTLRLNRLASAAVLALTAAASHATLVNGSFENGLTGWTFSGPVEARSDEQPSDGNLAAVFGWGNVPGGELSQAFATTIGTTYTVALDYWGWAGLATQTLQVDVVGSGTLLSQFRNDIGSIPATYERFSEQFTANSTTTVLRFSSLGSTINSDLAIDRVSVTAVTAVPEPASALLVSLGLLGLGARRRWLARGGLDVAAGRG